MRYLGVVESQSATSGGVGLENESAVRHLGVGLHSYPIEEESKADAVRVQALSECL